MSFTVFVIGATGTQGSAAIRHLRQQGHQVRAFTRDPRSRKAQALAALGVELVQGQLDDPATVRRGMEGAHAVHLVTDFFKNGVDGEERQGKQVADLARQAGIAHLVYASSASADRATGVPHFESKGRVERHIEASGVPFTFLRPTVFMEDLTEKQYVPPATWGMMRKVCGPDRKIMWVAVDDIGRAAAAVIGGGARYHGQKIALAGDERSIDEARAVFRSVDGKAPFALALPRSIFGRFVSRELLTMWEWFARERYDASVEATRAFLPGALDLARWLEGKRGATTRAA